MSIKGIRGAVTAENTEASIAEKSVALWKELIRKNTLEQSRIAHVIISTTQDLTKAYPAKFIRESGCTAPLFSCAEPAIEGALPFCIRILITAELDRPAEHVYLEGASVLRPDLSENRVYHIALDGPSGAGKSTIAKLLASRLGIAYLDTGAMYRAVALFMLNGKIDLRNRAEVIRALNDVEIDIVYQNGAQTVLLNGQDVGTEIREHRVSAAASLVSAISEVREELVAMQQRIASKQSAVLDGRDIGTVVLPDAKYKFFLTADVEERAKRRYEELRAKGENVSLEQIKRDIADRDRQDENRAVSPLRKADDAVMIDSSNLDINGVISMIMQHIEV